ncbi:ParB/RepB/Spo0J family partition protein [Acidithiobacillus sp.]|uniref:ParB/RepB/Spo0J family partition protein n=1 Tax=Acidithiobacillus sp. TaxID=1872118 RepID=UPI0026042070|nr:ParB/RepB/Spo0J family partition protein [Acidithiobacillus sp.]MDD5278705.1 ParB/RepB/Spo0J family partition protein [Acidithiobacillus sp.]
MPKEPFRTARHKSVIHPISPDGFRTPKSKEELANLDGIEPELKQPEPSSVTENSPTPVAEAASTENTALVSGSEQGRQTTQTPEGQYDVSSLDITKIYPGRYQPRFSISSEGIDDLASDIERLGRLVNPICVRPDSEGRFEIIAGERRWRACTLLGWKQIPATLIKHDEQKIIMAALSENIQRQDLTEMEIGFYLRRMLDEGIAHTKRELAVKAGIDRRNLYRYMAFTELPETLQKTIRQAPDVFAIASAEIMRDLCDKGYSDRVHEAANLILQGKLNTSLIRNWVTGNNRSREGDRRPIVRDGIRVGSLSIGKDEMRIRLSPELHDIPQEELAALISAAILSRPDGHTDTSLESAKASKKEVDN